MPGLRALLDQAPVLVWTCDTDARWTYVNRPWLAFTGTALEDELGDGWKRRLHPDDRERVDAACHAALASRRPFRIEYRLRRHDGQWRTLLCTATPRRAEGAWLGFVGSCVDVTELRAAERDAGAARRVLAAVLDALAARVAVLDREGRIVGVNRAWRCFASDAGLPLADAAVGRSYLDACDAGHAVGGEEARVAAQGIRDVLDGRREHFELEYPCHQPDRPGWFLMSATRVSGGSPAAAVVTHTDVTSLRESEQERATLQSRMQELQRFEGLSVLAGGIAHDFNNVLTVILGNSRLALADVGEGAPARERLEKIRVAAEHASALTAQMLAYSGRASRTLQALDANELIRDMRALLGAAVTEHGALEIDLPADLPLLEGDATQLRQVVVDLVTNAAEALGERGGTVRVRTGVMELDPKDVLDWLGTPDPTPGKYVTLEVSDTGVGVPSELRRRVFEPFFSTKFSGRGLGLAAVLGIVRSHGGLIRVEEAPGGGACVRVLLPAAPAAVVRTPVPPPPASGASAAGACVLVVDDEEGVLELAREFLTRAGFQVVVAHGGREALEALRARPGQIDAVLLDLIMPDLGGEETYRGLRELAPMLPVVLASGYSEDLARERFSEPGVAGFLGKPYEPEDLVAALRAALAGDRSPARDPNESP